MRNLFLWLALALVSGCTGGYYYPGTNLPKHCKISDGYCYHRHIVDNQMWEDVWIWTPQKGWTLRYQELAP